MAIDAPQAIPLRVLILEDRPEDAELTLRQLRKAGYALNWQRVETESDYRAHLDPALDLILADYHLPQFDGLHALRLLQESGLDIPFIIVSGAIGEDLAVAAMRTGAADYLLKDRLARLGEAVTHALAEKRVRQERQQAQEQIQFQLRRLAALRAVDIAIAGSLDLHVTLGVLLDQVVEQLGVAAARVQLFDSQARTLAFAADRGLQVMAEQASPPLGDTPAGRAALERRAVTIADLTGVEDDIRRYLPQASEGFKTYLALPLIAKDQVQGVLELFSRQPLAVDQEWQAFLEALADQGAIAIENISLFNDLQRSNAELVRAYDATLDGWARALELRDHVTSGHTRRVTDMTLRLARAMGLGEPELVHIRRGALLHDIGKMGITDAILQKPGPLTAEEMQIMQRHPVYAYEMLSPIAYLRADLDIPYAHHENWDGTGYPRGLAGDQIPLPARIFALIDVWDALTSERPYRVPWPAGKVLNYIHERAGSQFDPQVVDAFLNMLDAETGEVNRCNGACESENSAAKQGIAWPFALYTSQMMAAGV